jgi:hypothetical protein
LHQVPLHNIESRDLTVDQTFILSLLWFVFIHINFNCASDAAPQQGFAAPDGAPDFCLILFLFVLIYFNCALGAVPQHKVAAPDRAPDFLFNLFRFVLIYFNCASGATTSCSNRRGTRLLFHFIMFNLF